MGEKKMKVSLGKAYRSSPPHTGNNKQTNTNTQTHTHISSTNLCVFQWEVGCMFICNYLGPLECKHGVSHRAKRQYLNHVLFGEVGCVCVCVGGGVWVWVWVFFLIISTAIILFPMNFPSLISHINIHTCTHTYIHMLHINRKPSSSSITSHTHTHTHTHTFSCQGKPFRQAAHHFHQHFIHYQFHFGPFARFFPQEKRGFPHGI